MKPEFCWMSSEESQLTEVWLERQVTFASVRVRAVTTLGGPRSRYLENQDVVLLTKQHARARCVVVDGAGSTTAGKQAAYICAKEANDLSSSLQEVYARANERIRKETRQGEIFDPKTSGYAAVVGVDIDLATRNTDIVFWGDCRSVLLRQGKVNASGTTLPQNALFDQVMSGNSSLEQYYAADGPSYLSGGLGFDKDPGLRGPVVQSILLQPDDVLLLGSDGIWDQISDYELQECWQVSRGDVDLFFRTIQDVVFERNNATHLFELFVGPERSVRYCPDGADNASLIMLCPTPGVV